MTDFYNVKDKKIQCGICNDWVDKDFFIKFENNHVLYACCKSCAEKFAIFCGHKGTTRVEIGRTTEKAWEDEITKAHAEWEYEEERVICNFCNNLISSSKIRKRYNYHSLSGIKYGSWESC